MTPFRDLPIRRKVAVAIIVTSAIVLLFTAAAFMTYEWVAFRRAALRNLETLSRVIADNCTAALVFNDADDARNIVATLRAEPDIVSAAIYDARGQRIAYYTAGDVPAETLATVPEAGHVFSGSHLFLYQRIAQEGRQLGTLVVNSSLEGVQHHFGLYGGIVLLILVTSSVLAFALSSQLQRRITDPIQELAATAQAISLHGDYARRATRFGEDELGALTDSFNRMLDEIKERESRLSESKERLRVALTAADLGTWRYYPDKRLSIVDENFRRLYGLPPGGDTAPIEEIHRCIMPEDLPRILTEFRKLMGSQGAQYALEYRVRGSGDTPRWIRDRGRVIRRDDGTIDYITGGIVDITERRHAEEEVHRLNADLEQRVAQRTAELEQANRELEAFTYSVSHDLRGPLRHMAGYAEIISEDSNSQLSDEARNCVARISSAAARLTRLVDSLLNLSRVGRKQLVLQRTRLDDVVTGALRELETEMQNRQVRIHRQALPTVEVDPSLLHIVFVNLLSNALKYSRPRPVAEITIGLEVANGETKVFVRDNGVGFDPRFKDKLFGVFERLHSAALFEGTGIGLATVDRIIRKHGGRIWAESAIDQGATFYFTLRGM